MGEGDTRTRQLRAPRKSHSPDDSELDAYWPDDGQSADDRSALSPRPTTPPSPPPSPPPRPRVASQRDVAARRTSIDPETGRPGRHADSDVYPMLLLVSRRGNTTPIRSRARRSSRSRKRYLTARMTFDSTWRRASTRRRGVGGGDRQYLSHFLLLLCRITLYNVAFLSLHRC